MTTSLFVRVPRPQDGPTPPQAKPFTIHSKRWVYVLVPLGVSLGNLVEARYEKWRGFEVGANEYAASENSGKVYRAGALKGALDKANAHVAGLIAEAKNEARAEVEIGRYERQTKIDQGHYKNPIGESMANGFIVALMGNTPEIARLAFERAKLLMAGSSRRYFEIDTKTGDFQIRERIMGDDDAASERRGHLVELGVRDRLRIEALVEQGITDGARELASSAGATPCGSN